MPNHWRYYGRKTHFTTHILRLQRGCFPKNGCVNKITFALQTKWGSFKQAHKISPSESTSRGRLFTQAQTLAVYGRHTATSSSMSIRDALGFPQSVDSSMLPKNLFRRRHICFNSRYKVRRRNPLPRKEPYWKKPKKMKKGERGGDIKIFSFDWNAKPRVISRQRACLLQLEENSE